jgi:uncharacterized protein YlxP (DUF503 family)
MFVGVARYVIQIPGARNLKERRRVVNAFKDRLRARVSVSVAEVGDVERYQVATVGVAVVGRSAALCQEALSSALSIAERLPDAVLAEQSMEIVPYGAGGRSLPPGIEALAARREGPLG